MNAKKLSLAPRKLAIVQILAIASIASSPVQVWAQTERMPVIFTPPKAAEKEPSGSDRGTPGSREGGAPRPSETNCPKTNLSLTALVHAEQQNLSNGQTTESIRGLTVDKYPSFWFYIPYTAPLSAEFILLDENDEEFYKTTFPLTPKQGVLSVRLATDPTAKPLEIDKKYRWQFSIICNPGSPSANIFVEGWVQRVDPQVALPGNLISQIEKATLRDRSVLYAASGIWYDALTILGDLLQKNPDDRAIGADWAELLGSVGLSQIAREPIVQRHPPDN